MQHLSRPPARNQGEGAGFQATSGFQVPCSEVKTLSAGVLKLVFEGPALLGSCCTLVSLTLLILWWKRATGFQRRACRMALGKEGVGKLNAGALLLDFFEHILE